MSKDKVQIGKIGENIAIEYLKSNNYKILEQNFRAKRLGEIDIIAEENGYLVFVEVKARRGYNFGTPQESINIIKQKKLRNLANFYIKQKNIKDKNYRFDVVAIVIDTFNNLVKIDLIKYAFLFLVFFI